MLVTDPITPPPDPPCTATTPRGVPPAGFVSPPPPPPSPFEDFGLMDPAPNAEGRLAPCLRNAAQTRDTMTLLTESAVDHYLAAHPTAWQAPPIASITAVAQALADLAVTGRQAFEQFRSLRPTEATLDPLVRAQLVSFGLAPAPADVTAASTATLDRAYAVAQMLRGGPLLRAASRPGLGWIAVSGEDDVPHRPVNVPTMPFRQFDIDVRVPVSIASPPGTPTPPPATIRVRFYIASQRAAPEPPPPGPRQLVAEPTPIIPAGDRVLLFIHGHSSSAEEAGDIIPALHMAGNARGTSYTVLTFDLPTNGYATPVDHASVADEPVYPNPEPPNAGPVTAPLLDFIENAIVAFVDALDLIAPFKTRFAGIIGGSLGGNMGLRLGRRNLTASPWIANGIVSWDPGSAWAPMLDVLKVQGVDNSRGRWQDTSESWHQDDPTRASYFKSVFDTATVPFILPPQPEMWFSPSFACRDAHITSARLARHEMYNPIFQRWHWRAAGEQLIYSHVDRVVHDDPTSPFRYTLNTVRQLLAAGADDDYDFANIYSATRTLAGLMTSTPGQSLFLLGTGHSIHTERPVFFAGQIAAFLP